MLVDFSVKIKPLAKILAIARGSTKNVKLTPNAQKFNKLTHVICMWNELSGTCMDLK